MHPGLQPATRGPETAEVWSPALPSRIPPDPRLARAVRWLAFLGTVAAICLASEVLIPVAMASLLAFVLVTPAAFLERRGLGRVPSACLVGALAYLILGSVGLLGLNQLSDLISELPRHSRELEAKLTRVSSTLSGTGGAVMKSVQRVLKSLDSTSSVASTTPQEGNAGGDPEGEPRSSAFNLSSEDHPIFVRVVDPSAGFLRHLPGVASAILHPLGALGVVSLLTMFILLRREDLRNRLIHILSRGRFQGVTIALGEATARVGKYLAAQSILNGTYGAAIAVGLLLIGVPSWALWGLLAGAFRFLPYIGPFLGGVPPVLLLAITSGGWGEPLAAAGLFVGCDLFFYAVLEPWVYGTSAGVSPFGILLAALFWTWAWGPIGLILSTPLTVCVIVGGKHFPALRFLTTLLGDDEPLTPGEKYYQRLLAGAEEEASALVEESRKKDDSAGFLVEDEVLLPALLLAEKDLLSGELSQEALASILEHMRVSSGEATTAPGEPAEVDADAASRAPAPRQSTPTILCVSAVSDLDWVLARLLSDFLESKGTTARVVPPDLLVGEILELAAELEPDAVFVCALASSGTTRTRALLKRLRSGVPGHCEVLLLQPELRQDTSGTPPQGSKLFARALQELDRLRGKCSLGPVARPLSLQGLTPREEQGSPVEGSRKSAAAESAASCRSCEPTVSAPAGNGTSAGSPSRTGATATGAPRTT